MHCAIKDKKFGVYMGRGRKQSELKMRRRKGQEKKKDKIKKLIEAGKNAKK
jgi:hypothetical protein